MRRASIDLFQRFSSLSFAFKGRQRGDISFFARQYFKFLLLARSFLFRPSTRRVARNRFDPPDSRRNRFFLYDPERTYLTCQSYVRATAEFHGVTIESFRFAADLKHAHHLAEFLAEELDNVLSFPGLRVRNFCPRYRCILSDFVVHQSFYVAHLLLRQCRARKIKRQFVRANITSLLCCIRGNDFVKGPVQQMCDCMMALNCVAPISIN